MSWQWVLAYVPGPETRSVMERMARPPSNMMGSHPPAAPALHPAPPVDLAAEGALPGTHEGPPEGLGQKMGVAFGNETMGGASKSEVNQTSVAENGGPTLPIHGIHGAEVPGPVHGPLNSWATSVGASGDGNDAHAPPVVDSPPEMKPKVRVVPPRYENVVEDDGDEDYQWSKKTKQARGSEPYSIAPRVKCKAMPRPESHPAEKLGDGQPVKAGGSS